jgi:acyl-lipid omega-6 desaturase (Delta-12 desaturase)
LTITEPPAVADGTIDADEVRRAGSLRPVIDVIPDSCYDNPTWRGLAVFARDGLFYAAAVTGLILTDRWYFVIPLWILAGLAVSGLFVVGHDAAHQALFKSRRLNGIVGRIAMLPSLHVFEAWVLGHNRIHHGHTIKAEFDFVWHPQTPEEYEAKSRWSKLVHRLEWSMFGYGIYYMRQVWWQKMIAFDPTGRHAKDIKRDSWIMKSVCGAAGIGLLALGWATYGSVFGSAWMLFKVGIVPFVLFCYVIGWVVHVHHIDKSIEWHGRREWTKYHGQVEGTTIIHAPRWLDLFLHQILEHSPHHVDMRIPMYHLREAGQAMVAHFPVPERKLRWRDVRTNTKACKLYDFDEHRWMTYAEGRDHLAAQAAPVDESAAA